MDDDFTELARLAGQVRKSLHWAVFLVVIMALILVIDLQLKKSIGELAVEVARGREPAPRPAGDPPAAGNRGDGVERTPGLAAGSDPGQGSGENTPAGGVDGKTVRPRGNGRRAGGSQ